MIKAVFYFVDGYAWQYISGPTSAFRPTSAIASRPMETVLGYSSSIVPVLISGELPAETGIWTEYYRDDQSISPWGALARQSRLASVPMNMARLVAFRIARKAGHQSAHRLRIPLELSHHFRRHDIDYKRMPPCALGVPTIVDACDEVGMRMAFRFIASSDDAADVVGDIEHHRVREDVLFLYDCTIDHAGHARGPDTNELRTYLDRVAETFDALAGIAHSACSPEVLMFSDHGMTKVKAEFDIFRALAPLRIGRDFLAFPDSTFTRFWYPSERARSAVRDALAEAPGSFLNAVDAARYGVPFEDSRYGEDVLIADEGVVFHPSYISPSFFRTAFPDKGMHGYRPECASADGVVVYCGTAGLDDMPSRVRAQDLYGLMRRILTAVSI